jgi:hypothetical protein
MFFYYQLARLAGLKLYTNYHFDEDSVETDQFLVSVGPNLDVVSNRSVLLAWEATKSCMNVTFAGEVSNNLAIV